MKFGHALLATLLVASSLAVRAEEGVTDSEILLGMCNVLTGPAAELGLGVKRGSLAYFERVNKSGGINGRKIRVVSYDDGYEPRNTVSQTRRLVNDDKVFALFGYVGTPTSTAIMPLLAEAKVPFWAPFTGAEFLRNPVNHYIFNVRSSYFDEAETQVKYLAEQRGFKRIGVFIQNDAYGLAVKGGILKALKKRGLEITGEGTYERNTTDVAAAVAVLKKAQPDAISMVGTYKAIAAFVQESKAQGFNPVFLNVSFVGTSALAKELGNAGDGVLITQVVPSPYDATMPIVSQYRADMKAAGYNDPDFVDFEGYVNAAVFVEALTKAGPHVTRASFLAAAESLSSNIGGLAVSFSATNHQGLRQTYLTQLSHGRATLVP